MDLKTLLENLDNAVMRGDEDEAVRIDTDLAVHERVISDALIRMTKEHDETMNFIFREWVMNNFDQSIYIVLILLAFFINTTFIAIGMGLIGAICLISSVWSRKEYAKFASQDLWRMRKEKMMAQEYKRELNYIREYRFKHNAFLEGSRERKEEKEKKQYVDDFMNSLNKTMKPYKDNDEGNNDETARQDNTEKEKK